MLPKLDLYYPSRQEWSWLLPPLLQCWHFRCAPSCPVFFNVTGFTHAKQYSSYSATYLDHNVHLFVRWEYCPKEGKKALYLKGVEVKAITTSRLEDQNRDFVLSLIFFFFFFDGGEDYCLGN